MMHRAIVVGCGKIGGGDLGRFDTHGEAYFNHAKFQLTAGIDSNLSRARTFANRFECEYELELRLALERHSPDVVSVCTPDDTHFHVVCEILASKSKPRVIFLEKPVCVSAEQFLELIRITERENVLIVVNHSRRFDRTLRNLKARISLGEFGNLNRVRTVYYNGWMHNGTHIVDTLTFLFDDTVSIEKFISRVNGSDHRDPTLEFQARLRNLDIPVAINAVNADLYQIFEFDFWFEEARLRIENFGNRIILERKSSNEIGERVLCLVSGEFSISHITPINEALDRIESYLNSTNDISQLVGCLLNDVAPTMETLFEGLKVYEEAVTDRF